MKTNFTYLAILLLLFSCASTQNSAAVSAQLPTLGTIGKKDGSLMHKTFQTSGKPYLKRALVVSVVELPFSKSDYKTYIKHKKQQGVEAKLQFVDSLTKPKYINLDLSDKITLQSVFLKDENSDVCAYISKDDEMGIVTRISLYADHELKQQLLRAEEAFLIQNRTGKLVLELLNDKTTVAINIPQNEIFDYRLSAFCWGEDRYGNKRVDALVPYNDRCPNGTERKAHKLDELKSYLKL